jgi:protein tyrosine phosphatase
MTIAKATHNLTRNRYANILPTDKSRVQLLRETNDNHNPDGYINATYVDGDSYIATQAPLKDTISDYWQMVDKQNVNAIVMTTNLEVKNQLRQRKPEKFWPEDINTPLLSVGRMLAYLLRVKLCVALAIVISPRGVSAFNRL